MTWLDIITPIPKTLIPDDERRKGVNRAFIIATILILVFLFIYWLFKDLAGVTDAAEHLFLLVLLELAKVLAGFIIYLVVCWGFKVCMHVFTLKSEKPAPATSPEAPVEVPPEIDLSQPDPIAVRDLFTEGTKPYVISNLYDWIVLEGNRTGPQLAYLYIALTQNHLIESDSPKKLLEALVNTYSGMEFVSWSTLRHAYSDIKHRPEGRVKKEDQVKADAIFKLLTAPKPPK